MPCLVDIPALFCFSLFFLKGNGKVVDLGLRGGGGIEVGKTKVKM